MSLRKMGAGFTYDSELKRVTYSMKEYIRSKYSYDNGNINQDLMCIYLMTTNMHFYINDEDDLQNFLYMEHKAVEHEEIQERLYHTNSSIEFEEKTIVRNIPEGISRYVLTDERYEAMKDEEKIQIIDYIAFHQE